MPRQDHDHRKREHRIDAQGNAKPGLQKTQRFRSAPSEDQRPIQNEVHTRRNDCAANRLDYLHRRSALNPPGNKMTDFEYEVPMPGYFIQQELDARGWIQRDLAFVLGIEETALNKIIKGKTGISLEMSKALGTAFTVDPDFFANLQKTYDLAHT